MPAYITRWCPPALSSESFKPFCQFIITHIILNDVPDNSSILHPPCPPYRSPKDLLHYSAHVCSTARLKPSLSRCCPPTAPTLQPQPASPLDPCLICLPAVHKYLHIKQASLLGHEPTLCLYKRLIYAPPPNLDLSETLTQSGTPALYCVVGFFTIPQHHLDMSPFIDRTSLSDSYEASSRESESVTTPDSALNEEIEPLRIPHEDRKPYIQYVEHECRRDLSPSTSVYARSSVDTYASTAASQEDLALERDEELARDHEYDYIPPLPSYHHEISEPNVRASTAKDFAQLFPSMNRLSIRHDDFTTDGNMNLRVDTIVPGRRRTAVQLFHLRMYDLAKREFSLRRYSRESGREVCNSKRQYLAPAALSRPTLQRSMSSAMKTLSSAAKPQSRRQNSSSSTVSTKDKRPATSHSYDTNADSVVSSSSRATSSCEHNRQQGQAQPRPTNSIKLEFSNYARVDVQRRGSRNNNNKRYEFEWWGHRYTWRRAVEQHRDGVVSFHLLRDGQATPVAHIVPETRTPLQVEDDERAGGWIPPCYMWINDNDILDAATDVAE